VPGGVVMLPRGGRTGACKQFHGGEVKDIYAFIQAQDAHNTVGALIV
jgi:hypothetical protein